MVKLVNNVKTAALLGGLMGLCMLCGYVMGGVFGVTIGFLIGGVMNFVAFFYSDKIALASMRAQQVNSQSHPQLMRMVQELSSRANLPLPRVYISPAQAPNAFATGRSPKHSAVCITEGLMAILDQKEMAGVIGHELAHIRNRDILISTVAATIGSAISMLGYMLYFIPLGGDRRGGNPFVLIALLILAPIAATVIKLWISRSREFVADADGAAFAGDPHPLASALRKLETHARQIPLPVSPSQENMFIVAPLTTKQGLAGLFRTHPPTEDRIRALIGR